MSIIRACGMHIAHCAGKIKEWQYFSIPVSKWVAIIYFVLHTSAECSALFLFFASTPFYFQAKVCLFDYMLQMISHVAKLRQDFSFILIMVLKAIIIEWNNDQYAWMQCAHRPVCTFAKKYVIQNDTKLSV